MHINRNTSMEYLSWLCKTVKLEVDTLVANPKGW